MLKVVNEFSYFKKIEKKSLWKRVVFSLICTATIFPLVGCASTNDKVVLERDIDKFAEETEKAYATIEKLEEEKKDLEKKIEELQKEKDYLEKCMQEVDNVTSAEEICIPFQEDNYRIFYDGDEFLDYDYKGDAFQFYGAEDYEMEANVGEIVHPTPINRKKMGEYFVELRKNEIAYLVDANDYTEIKIKREFGGRDFEDVSTLVYCPYYDPNNGGKDSFDGLPGYILSVENYDIIGDYTTTIYDVDTFEVLARDCILYNGSLGWHWADKVRNLIHIEPCQTEDGLKGEYNCTIIEKDGVNYLVDYSTFEVLETDVEDFECNFDAAGVRIITITHTNGKKAVYINDTLKPINTDVLKRELKK